jgi:hypothetical protein
MEEISWIETCRNIITYVIRVDETDAVIAEISKTDHR